MCFFKEYQGLGPYLHPEEFYSSIAVNIALEKTKKNSGSSLNKKHEDGNWETKWREESNFKLKVEINDVLIDR